MRSKTIIRFTGNLDSRVDQACRFYTYRSAALASQFGADRFDSVCQAEKVIDSMVQAGVWQQGQYRTYTLYF